MQTIKESRFLYKFRSVEYGTIAMKCILSILFFIYSIVSFSQNREIDSLKALLHGGLTNHEHVDLLNTIAFTFNKIDLDTTYQYAALALEKAKTIDYTLGTARALNLQSGKYLYRKEYDKSIQINEDALALVQDHGDHKILSQIYNTLAVNYYYMQNEARSIELLQQSLDESKLAKDSLTSIIISSNIAYMHLENDELELAEGYLNESIVLSDLLNYRVGKAIALRSLGTLHFKRGDSDMALDQYNKGLKIALEDNDHFNAGHLFLLIGKLRKERGEYSSALKNLTEAENRFIIRKEDLTRAECYYEIADVYNAQGKYDNALENAALGNSLAGTSASYENRVRYSQIMASAFEGKANLPEAYRYQKAIKSWSDSLYNREKLQKVNELETKYQLQRKNVENQLLKEEKAKQEAVISEQKTRNYAVIIFSLLASALAFVSYRGFRTNRNYSAELEEVVEQRTVDLKNANAELKRSNEELERFAYIASHDLKEPLRNISTFTQLIKKEINGNTNEKLDSYIGIVDGMTEQMYFLVNGILQYSKIANAKDFKPVDLNLVCTKVQEYLKVQIAEKDANIKIDALPTIMANEAQVFQVFKNLIENAVKYTTCCQPKIQVKYREGKQAHEFSVEDNGIGIDEKYLDQIFEMFNRLHNRSEFKGAGLGLSIVKKIIHDMGGELSVESTPGEGSSFNFSLPKEPIEIEESLV